MIFTELLLAIINTKMLIIKLGKALRQFRNSALPLSEENNDKFSLNKK